MPQLNIADFAPQLIWLAICFIGLYIIMAKIAIPRIGGVLEQRRDKIASDLDQAQSLKNDTEKAIEAYEQALNEARAKAHAIAEENRKLLNEQTARVRAEIEEKLNAKTAEAEARINATKQEAVSHVKIVAAEAASAIVEKLIGASVSQKKLDAALKPTTD